MGRIGVTMSVSLDGVVQGLGRADEDQRGGFDQGGWGQGYQDEVSMAFMSDGMAANGAMLFGRRTYEDMLGYWTTTTDPNPFTDFLTHSPKYVASRSDQTTLAYPASTLLAGEAVDTVGRLREEFDGELTILGSGELVRSLHAANLVDEYVLQIHPIVLGQGTRLFGDSARSDLDLVRSVTTTTGVIIAQYTVRRQER